MGSLSLLPGVLGQIKFGDAVSIALDIIIVFFIVYRVLLLIRGTRTVQVLTGIGVFSLAYFLSDRFNLYVVNFLLRQFFDYVFLILVIIFQDEIRRALATLGRNPFSGNAAKTLSVQVIEVVVQACQVLATKKTGAIIVLERHQGLKNYTEGATSMDAQLSAELLVSIFQATSPIHDGAAIIREGKILAAGCFFPVTLDSGMDKNLGTRHRAAMAISEETDAVAVVVSEERGEVSVAERGQLKRDLSPGKLRSALFRAFEIEKIRENTESGGAN